MVGEWRVWEEKREEIWCGLWVERVDKKEAAFLSLSLGCDHVMVDTLFWIIWIWCMSELES